MIWEDCKNAVLRNEKRVQNIVWWQHVSETCQYLLGGVPVVTHSNSKVAEKTPCYCKRITQTKGFSHFFLFITVLFSLNNGDSVIVL